MLSMIFEMVMGILNGAGADASAIEIVSKVFEAILGIFGA